MKSMLRKCMVSLESINEDKEKPTKRYKVCNIFVSEQQTQTSIHLGSVKAHKSSLNVHICPPALYHIAAQKNAVHSLDRT